MPLALLLQQTFSTLQKDLELLEPWNQLVRLEALLIERARSVFLVRWFGSGLPTQRHSLRAWIANLADLQARYLAVHSSQEAGPEGPNLMEPLAGLAGELIGVIASPTTLLALSITAILRCHGWATKALAGLGALILVVIFPKIVLWTVAGVLFAPAAVAAIAFLPAILFAGLIGTDLWHVQSVHDHYILLGALAGLLMAANTFIQVLLGPREQVRNPLLLQVLRLGDALAVLLPQLLAAIAVVITRIGGIMLPLVNQLILLSAFIDEMKDLIAFIIQDLLETLKDFFTKYLYENSINLLLFALQELFQVVTKGIMQGIESITSWLQQRGKLAAVSLVPWLGKVIAIFADLLAHNPLTKLLESWGPAVSIIHHILEKPAKSKAPTAPASPVSPPTAPPPSAPPAPIAQPPASGSSPAGGLPKWISTYNTAARALGFLPLLTPLPDTAAIEKKLGGPPILSITSGDDIKLMAAILDYKGLGPPYTLDETGKKALERAHHPYDVFAAERRELARQAGGPLKKVLEAEHNEELLFRDMIFAIVQHVLPAQYASSVKTLSDLFHMLDEKVYQVHGKRQKQDYPVRELEESNRLQPVVHRLRIAATGLDTATVRTWGSELRRALEVQPYFLPA